MTTMTKIDYEQGMKDMHEYVVNMISNSMDHEAMQYLTARQALGILLASLKSEEEDE